MGLRVARGLFQGDSLQPRRHHHGLPDVLWPNLAEAHEERLRYGDSANQREIGI